MDRFIRRQTHFGPKDAMLVAVQFIGTNMEAEKIILLQELFASKVRILSKLLQKQLKNYISILSPNYTVFQSHLQLGCDDGIGYATGPSGIAGVVPGLNYNCTHANAGFCSEPWFNSICRGSCGLCGSMYSCLL